MRWPFERTDTPPPASGLAGLVRGAAGTRATLVQALNMLDRGEIEKPLDGALGAAMDATDLPLRPAPPPPRHPAQDFIDEAREQAARDRDDMRVVLARKRAEVNAGAVYSRDLVAAQEDAKQRFERTRRLDRAEAELMERNSDA